LFTKTNQINRDYYYSLGESEQKFFVEKNDQFRQALLTELKNKPYPSSHYTTIYDTLMLLAYCFPINIEDGIIVDPVAATEIAQGDNNYLVLASGHWFLKESLVDWYSSTANFDKNLNPSTKAPYTAQDFAYIKSLARIQLEDKTSLRDDFETDPGLTLMAAAIGGALGIIFTIGFFLAPFVLLGGLVIASIGTYAGVNLYNHYSGKKDSAVVAVTCDVSPLFANQQSKELKQESLTTTASLLAQSPRVSPSVAPSSSDQSVGLENASSGSKLFEQKSALPSESKAASFVRGVVNKFRN